MTDQFENIIGYENLYKINRQGEIWSCWYQKVMKQQTNKSGYLFVNFKKEGTKHKGYVARLLALQYIPNPENKPQVDHIDRNKTNNCLENLRWYTIKEQANNKTTNISLLTEEEKAQKKENKKQYQANWARWNKLKTGKVSFIPVPALTKQRVEKTPLQIEKRNESNKKYRDTHIQTDGQKARSCARAKKQREDIKSDPEKAVAIKEYKRLKAAEYRSDPAYVEKAKQQALARKDKSKQLKENTL